MKESANLSSTHTKMHKPFTSGTARAIAAVEAVRVTLPTQGPIDVFIHHNTLHHVEHLPFEKAVESEAHERHANPYLPHREYLELLTDGRIDWQDVERALSDRDTCQGSGITGLSHLDIGLLAIRIPTEIHTSSSMRWLLSEGGLLSSYVKGCKAPAAQRIESGAQRHLHELVAAREDESLARLLSHPVTGVCPSWVSQEPCLQGYKRTTLDNDDLSARLALRMLWNAIGITLGHTPLITPKSSCWKAPAPHDEKRLDAVTIQLTSSYLDRGNAPWTMPKSFDGFLASALQLLKHGERHLPDSVCWVPRSHWIWQEIDGRGAAEIIALLLARLEVKDADWPSFLRRDLMNVAGWAGMVAVLEDRPSMVSSHPPSLIDFVALRLILRICLGGATYFPTEHSKTPGAEELARQIFMFCQLSGWSSRDVLSSRKDQISHLAKALVSFGDIQRRRVLHQAYERTFQRRILASLPRTSPIPPQGRSSFQAIFCLDEREESLRRHLEELDPNCLTYGTAGFFNVAVFYANEHLPSTPVPLCPVATSPRHLVVSEHLAQGALQRFAMTHERLIKHALRSIQTMSRRLVTGHMIALSSGFLVALIMTLRIISPRTSTALGRRLRTLGRKKQQPHLTLYREPSTPVRSDGLMQGFDANEMANRVEGLLKTIGLVRDFAPFVLCIGHGSSTSNNPFASAYECGACGGQRGDRNGRMLALMANRRDVRTVLADRGLVIPDDTVFVGGYHDTCTEAIDLYDLERLPTALTPALPSILAVLEQARMLNAHERCRRFDHLPNIKPHQALRHVQTRAMSLREPRPEYGHGSNAWCFVGPRPTTRGLFLDRRCFLVSYEPSSDPGGDVLEQTLAAIVPVCAGISLEYYFSRVDNRRYGAGTKLPHNISSMLGVMDGYLSDLRTGLPWQTVEIHEPMRLFIVVETRPPTLVQVLNRLPAVARLIRNRWIHVAVLDPETRESSWYDGESFHPFEGFDETLGQFPSSGSYYEGHAHHLWPARITASESLKA